MGLLLLRLPLLRLLLLMMMVLMMLLFQHISKHMLLPPPPTPLPYTHILWACLCAFLEKFGPGHFHFNVISFKFIVNGNLCFAFALLPLHLQLHNRVVRRACSFV